MRSLLRAAVLVLCTLEAQADQQAKVNALTPKEIAEGWILLFDGQTSFGWTVSNQVKMEDGMMVLGGDEASSATTTAGFLDSELSVDYRLKGTEPAYCVITSQMGKMRVGLSGSKQGSPTQRQETFLIRNGRLIPDPYQPAGGVSRLDGALQVRFEAPKGCQLFLRSVKLKPLGLRPIFNGKDLTGWKEFPGRKSKFTVTPEGWLNLKNGPGDLQTEGQWANFILQLECISNGNHLNSGVFFRCRPGEYQQGYEAQIRNQFTKEPTQEYTLEEYNPKSHELIGKKKAKYTAVDYGTGAIYRRQPARREVARDHEWFTMTVVANGRHFATWINGIQVTDWTDNRPLRDNARNGCRLEKGPISLQGHDPTTDLSFRNLRIAELPAPPEKK
jgi:hypothetical protein